MKSFVDVARRRCSNTTAAARIHRRTWTTRAVGRGRGLKSVSSSRSVGRGPVMVVRRTVVMNWALCHRGSSLRRSTVIPTPPDLRWTARPLRVPPPRPHFHSPPNCEWTFHWQSCRPLANNQHGTYFCLAGLVTVNLPPQSMTQNFFTVWKLRKLVFVCNYITGYFAF